MNKLKQQVLYGDARFCEDCKWFHTPWYQWKVNGQCRSFKARRTEYGLVTRSASPFAKSEREYGECRREGKNWEPKEEIESND